MSGGGGGASRFGWNWKGGKNGSAAQRRADGGEGDLKSFEFWWDPPGGAPRSWAGPAVGVVRYASSAQFIYYGGP